MNNAESSAAIKSAVETLIARDGYKVYPGSPSSHGDAFLQRKVRSDWPSCLTNDGIHINVEIFNMSRYGNTAPKANVEIVGEYRVNTWTKLQVYSVTLPTLLAEIVRIENELLDAWIALTKSRLASATREQR